MGGDDAGGARARAAAQRAARRAVRTGFFSRLFVRRARLTCLVATLVPLLAVVVIVATKSFKLHDPTYRDYLIRKSRRVRENDASEAARDDGAALADDPTAFLAGGSAGGAQPARRAAERTKKDDEFRITFVWRRPDAQGDVVDRAGDAAAGENLLTREAVAEMKRVEDEFAAAPEYAKYCWRDREAVACEGSEPPACAHRLSITAHPRLYGKYDADGRLCGVRAGSEAVGEAEFAAFLKEIVVPATPGNGERAIDGSVAGLLGREANGSATPATFVARSFFAFGLPFQGFADTDDGRAEGRVEYANWLEKFAPDLERSAARGRRAALRATVLGDAYSNGVFGAQALADLSFAVAAIVLVLLFMWLHMRSLFLAAAMMLQVVLAFPLAYFIYRLVARISYFSSLQIMTVFLVLGIAADDGFVFVDAWTQSAVVLGADCDLERRMSWTFRRSVKAMAVTSFTTALAFAFTAFSPVMPVGTLGWWAFFVVLLLYLQVVTAFPCAVVMWHRSLRPRTWATRFRRGDAPVLITAEDDEKNLESVDALDDGDSSGDGGAGVDASNAEAGGAAGAAGSADDRPAVPFWRRCLGGRKKDENEYRVVERFFRGRWLNWMNKARYALCALAAALFGASVYCATRVEPLSKSESFLPDDHPLLIASNLARDAFSNNDNERYTAQARVFWGVLGIDRSGTSVYDPEAIGEAVYDKEFDLKPAATQQHLLDACETLAGNKELTTRFASKDAVDCWIRDFSAWRTAEGGKPSFETYADDAALVADLRSFLGYTNKSSSKQPYLKHLEERRVVFADGGKRVSYTELRFETDVLEEEPARVTKPFFNKWKAAVDGLAAKAPKTASRPLVTLGYASMWAVTTTALISSAFSGLGSMLAVAFLVLALSTANVVVAMFATVAIGGIVANLLALIWVWGYEMGLTESVSVIIAAGVSFDFCAHIANAYIESAAPDRYSRTRDALTDLGISVLAGGLSTMLSAATLFLATITFFQKFARFVVSTVALSLVWSLVFLIALLLVLGPENDVGSLKVVFRKLSRRAGRRQAADAGDEEGDSKRPGGGAGEDSPAPSAPNVSGGE